ncbi:MAG: hypothetical protein GX913_03910 [Clostridiales bacterium]|nr:hypothetical protein [Clostridiales bacterium]
MKKKYIKKAAILGFLGVAFLSLGVIAKNVTDTGIISPSIVKAAEYSVKNDRILSGIYIGPVDVGDMTPEEAKAEIEKYVDGLKTKTVVLVIGSIVDESDSATAAMEDFGLAWTNSDVIEEALTLGKSGNLIKRYKAKKDIENDTVLFELEFGVDKDKILQVLEEKASPFEIEMINATLKKTANGFVATDEKIGKSIDIETSAEQINHFLEEGWDYLQEDLQFDVVTQIDMPTVTKEMCLLVKNTPIASFTTAYTNSGLSRTANIDVSVEKINGAVVMPGEEFSTLAYMTPFSVSNGYHPAGSYFNGKVVDSLGGGVCQVSTTLYNVVLLAELEVTDRRNHGLTVGYVPLAADAAVAESSNMDFKFVNSTNAPIYIEAYTYNKTVTFNIYGYDERDPNRRIEYVSETLERVEPPADVVTEDSTLQSGTRIVTQSAHVGYTAVLYKHIYENGVLVDKIKVNQSKYRATPAYVTIGTMPVDSTVVEPVDASVDALGDASGDNLIEDPSGEIPVEIPVETTPGPEVEPTA